MNNEKLSIESTESNKSIQQPTIDNVRTKLDTNQQVHEEKKSINNNKPKNVRRIEESITMKRPGESKYHQNCKHSHSSSLSTKSNISQQKSKKFSIEKRRIKPRAPPPPIVTKSNNVNVMNNKKLMNQTKKKWSEKEKALLVHIYMKARKKR